MINYKKKLNYENYSNDYKNYNIEQFTINPRALYVIIYIIIFISIYLFYLVIKFPSYNYHNLGKLVWNCIKTYIKTYIIKITPIDINSLNNKVKLTSQNVIFANILSIISILLFILIVNTILANNIDIIIYNMILFFSIVILIIIYYISFRDIIIKNDIYPRMIFIGFGICSTFVYTFIVNSYYVHLFSKINRSDIRFFKLIMYIILLIICVLIFVIGIALSILYFNNKMYDIDQNKIYLIVFLLFLVFLILSFFFNGKCVLKKNDYSKCYSINQYREMSNTEKYELTIDDKLRQKLNSCICPNPNNLNNCLSKNDCNNNQLYKNFIRSDAWSLFYIIVCSSIIIGIFLSGVVLYFKEIKQLVKNMKKLDLNDIIYFILFIGIMLTICVYSIKNLRMFINNGKEQT